MSKNETEQPDKYKNQAAVELSRLRWKDTTPEQRKAFMLPIQKKSKGHPKRPDQQRCPCGAMTMARAVARAGVKGTSYGHKRGCFFYKQEPRNRTIHRRQKRAS